MRRAPLALTLGDPAGVGPDITLQAWAALKEAPDCAFFLLGDQDLLARRARDLGVDVPVKVLDNAAEASDVFGRALPVLPIGATQSAPGAFDPADAPLVLNAIERAVRMCRSGEASGVVTNPIAKAPLYAAGLRFPGHTELLAELCREGDTPAPTPVMMLVGGRLRVALATIHLPLRAVADALTPELLEARARIVLSALTRDFGIEHPRLALAGLNPHAGEAGALGREEIEVINPVAARLRAEGHRVTDAQPGDTVFHFTLEGAADAVLAMYHDQGLAPLKTHSFWDGVNVTLGLPVVRASPDHGVAYEAAVAGTARADSLIAAIRLAARMAAARAGA